NLVYVVINRAVATGFVRTELTLVVDKSGAACRIKNHHEARASLAAVALPYKFAAATRRAVDDGTRDNAAVRIDVNHQFAIEQRGHFEKLTHRLTGLEIPFFANAAVTGVVVTA